MDTLKALIFDVDGTLAETERDGHRLAFNRAFQEFGLPWRWDEGLYGKLLDIGGGKERITYFLKRYRSDFQPPMELEVLVKKLHMAKTAHFKALLETGGIQPRPGVLRLIQSAQKRGIRLAIATTSAPANALALLTSVFAPEAPSWFEVIAAGDMVPAKKPAPDVYQYVLDHLVLPPEACVAIEDSRQGLLAATTAGLATAVTVNDYTRHHDLALADLVVNHLGEPSEPFEVLQGPKEFGYFFTLDLAQYLLINR